MHFPKVLTVEVDPRLTRAKLQEDLEAVWGATLESDRSRVLVPVPSVGPSLCVPGPVGSAAEAALALHDGRPGAPILLPRRVSQGFCRGFLTETVLADGAVSTW